MAYIPSQDDSNDDTVQNVSTQIFNNATQQMQPNQPVGSQQSQGGGDQSAPIQGGGANTNAPKAPSQSASSSKEVVRRNQDKIQSPVDLNQMSSNIAKAKTDFQNEANSYVQAQKSANYSLPQDQINNALSQGGDAFNAVGQRLNQARPDLKPFEQKTNTDYSSQIKQLEDASLKNYFKNSGGPTATAGEAAFDTMLLGKNKQFKQDRDKVKNEAAALSDTVKADRDKAQADADAAYQQSYDAGTQKIRDAISSQINPVLSTAQAQAAAESQKRAQQAAAIKAGVMPADYSKWLSDMANRIGENDAEDMALQDFLVQNVGGVGAGGRMLPGTAVGKSFVNLGPTEVSANNYLSQAQADMINRGNSLLGAGGTAYQAAGGPAALYNYNTGAAEGWLRNELAQVRAAQEAERIRQQEAAARAAQNEANRQAEEQAAADREYERQQNRGQNAVTKTGSDVAKKGKDFIERNDGKIICTEYWRLGMLPTEILRADLDYQAKYADPESIKNYLAWAIYVVPVIRENKFARALYWPIAKKWAYHMAFKMGVIEDEPFGGYLFESLFLKVSNLIGSTIRKSRRASMRLA